MQAVASPQISLVDLKKSDLSGYSAMAQVVDSTPRNTPSATALDTLIGPTGNHLLLVLLAMLLSITILLLRRSTRYRPSYHNATSDLECDYKACVDPLHKGELLSVDDIPPPLRSIYKHECYTSDTIAPLYEQAFTRRHSYPLASAASVKWDHVEVFAAKVTDIEQKIEKPATATSEVWRRRTLVFEQ